MDLMTYFAKNSDASNAVGETEDHLPREDSGES